MIAVDLHTRRVYRLADARDPKWFARIFVNAKTAVKPLGCCFDDENANARVCFVTNAPTYTVGGILILGRRRTSRNALTCLRTLLCTQTRH